MSTTSEGNKEDECEECIVISSDEDSDETEPPATPSTPLTPGSQMDLELQNWLDMCEQTEENHASCQLDFCTLDAMMSLQSSETQNVYHMSPVGLAGKFPGCFSLLEEVRLSQEKITLSFNFLNLPFGDFVVENTK